MKELLRASSNAIMPGHVFLQLKIGSYVVYVFIASLLPAIFFGKKCNVKANMPGKGEKMKGIVCSASLVFVILFVFCKTFAGANGVYFAGGICAAEFFSASAMFSVRAVNPYVILGYHFSRIHVAMTAWSNKALENHYAV